LIKHYNLEKKVKVELGFVPEDEIGYYFSACNIVVLPYTHLDTHGGIGALALPFKKPIIVSDVGGLPEYVKDKKAIVKPGNPHDLYNKILTILKDKKLQLKLSKDSESLIKDFSWDKIADKTIEAYQKLIS
jgi:glycosyltransferase involved in cell wall biosynthesis